MVSQQKFVNTQGNRRYLCIRCVINLFYDQPSSLVHKLLAFAIRNKMFMDPKMNWYSGNWLESMHNINSSTIIRNMIEFASKQGGKWKHCHLNYDWNMCAFITLEDFIMKGTVHKMFIVILHTIQMTKQWAFLKLSPKLFWYWLWSPCTKHGHHTFYPCLASTKACEQLKAPTIIQTKHPHCNWQELNFLKKNLIII
jgi:hypothetical protein